MTLKKVGRSIVLVSVYNFTQEKNTSKLINNIHVRRFSVFFSNGTEFFTAGIFVFIVLQMIVKKTSLVIRSLFSDKIANAKIKVFNRMLMYLL